MSAAAIPVASVWIATLMNPPWKVQIVYIFVDIKRPPPRFYKLLTSACGRMAAMDVYERLRTLIATGRVAPGMRMIEIELARQLAVSRTPVREAMRRLTQEGWAQVVSSGAKTQIAVAPVTRADLLDLFGIIGALEGAAGRGAAALPPAERRGLAERLTRANDAFAAETRRQPRRFERLFAAHDAFHDILVRESGTARSQALVASVRPQVQRYEMIYATVIGADFSASLREHRAIVAAVRSGGADRIEAAIRRNWSNSAKRLVRGSSTAPIGDYRAIAPRVPAEEA
jgi:DNA-binding GntR family transcriptional regulator